MLEQFLRCTAMRHAGSALPVRALHAEYLATLGPSEQAWWPRSRFVTEAARLGFALTLRDRRQAILFPVPQSPAGTL